MDLFKLEKDKYNNLLLSLDYVMKEKGKDYHQNFGIAIYVLEKNELIFDNFTKGHLFNDEVDIFYNQFLENWRSLILISVYFLMKLLKTK